MIRVAVGVVLALGTFAVLHTGGLGADVCARAGFSVSEFSWWPPGVACSGGEPVFTVTKFNPAMVLALPAIYLIVWGAAAMRQKSQLGRAQRG